MDNSIEILNKIHSIYLENQSEKVRLQAKQEEALVLLDKYKDQTEIREITQKELENLKEAIKECDGNIEDSIKSDFHALNQDLGTILKEKLEQMEEDLECMICMETVSADRSFSTICSKSHHVCVICKPKIACCPLCKETIIEDDVECKANTKIGEFNEISAIYQFYRDINVKYNLNTVIGGDDCMLTEIGFEKSALVLKNFQFIEESVKFMVRVGQNIAVVSQGEQCKLSIWSKDIVRLLRNTVLPEIPKAVAVKGEEVFIGFGEGNMVKYLSDNNILVKQPCGFTCASEIECMAANSRVLLISEEEGRLHKYKANLRVNCDPITHLKLQNNLAFGAHGSSIVTIWELTSLSLVNSVKLTPACQIYLFDTWRDKIVGVKDGLTLYDCNGQTCSKIETTQVSALRVIGDLVLVVCEDGHTKIFDLNTGISLHETVTHTGLISSMC